MKWAKYFGLLLLSFCLFFGLSPAKLVKADDIGGTIGNILNNKKYGIYIRTSNNQYYIYAVQSSYPGTLNIDNNRIFYSVNNVPAVYQYWILGNNDPLNNLNGNYDYMSSSNSNSYNYSSGDLIIVLKGDVIINTNNNNVFGSLEDYTDSIAPTWWDNIKDAFMDFVGSDAMSAVISGDWLSYLDEVLFGGLWTVKVGEGEDELVNFYTVSATPSPSPSPTPTQIPVQINIDPATGNVTYNYYIDVSGTPVPTSSPINPNPPTGSGGGGGDSGLSEPVGVEDYYEPDDSLSLPNLRIFQFKLNIPGTETDIGVDSLDNNFEVMNSYLEDNAEAITTVSSFFQVIPSEWFLLLGAIACFPIIAAMIKSLLGG